MIWCVEFLPARWRAKIVCSAGCWLWRGWNSGNGFGKLKIKGKAWMAHRAVWNFFGLPLPRGRVLDHLCRNRACCNPAHLELVTVRENTARGEARLFQAKKHGARADWIVADEVAQW